MYAEITVSFAENPKLLKVTSFNFEVPKIVALHTPPTARNSSFQTLASQFIQLHSVQTKDDLYIQ